MLEEAVQIFEEPIQFWKIFEELIQFLKNGSDFKSNELDVGRMDHILEEWKNGTDFPTP